jgi:hypothetical protein
MQPGVGGRCKARRAPLNERHHAPKREGREIRSTAQYSTGQHRTAGLGLRASVFAETTSRIRQQGARGEAADQHRQVFAIAGLEKWSGNAGEAHQLQRMGMGRVRHGRELDGAVRYHHAHTQ